jgi:hypothetical protein
LLGDQIREDEMAGVFKAHGSDEKYVRNSGRNRSSGKLKRRWDDHIKINYNEVW